MTVGKSDEKRRLAEEMLYTVWDKAVSMTGGSNDFQEMRETVENILEIIKNMEDVTIKSVEKHCIIMTIKAASAIGLLDLINYTSSAMFFDAIESISTSLSDYFDEDLTVFAILTLGSMKQTLDTLSKYNLINNAAICLISEITEWYTIS